MRKIIFCLIFLSCAVSVSAQVVRVRSGSLGKLLITKGKQRSAIDLSKDVAGCRYVSGAAKRELDKKGCTAPTASYYLFDTSNKNGQIFLLVTAEASENCNVCGRCGASTATTILWLKLDSRLRVSDKKSVPLSFCNENISLISPISDSPEDRLKLEFKNNLMTVEFEKRIYGADAESDKDVFEFTHLEYSRETPEKGFVIKTEKRNKSSADGN